MVFTSCRVEYVASAHQSVSSAAAVFGLMIPIHAIQKVLVQQFSVINQARWIDTIDERKETQAIPGSQNQAD